MLLDDVLAQAETTALRLLGETRLVGRAGEM